MAFRVRKALGGLIGIQSLIEPQYEHTPRGDQDGHPIDDEHPDHEDQARRREGFEAELRRLLGAAQVDPGRIRQCLEDALQHGLDWRALYESVIRRESAERPYLTPVLPPTRMVAPVNMEG